MSDLVDLMPAADAAQKVAVSLLADELADLRRMIRRCGSACSMIVAQLSPEAEALLRMKGFAVSKVEHPEGWEIDWSSPQPPCAGAPAGFVDAVSLCPCVRDIVVRGIQDAVAQKKLEVSFPLTCDSHVEQAAALVPGLQDLGYAVELLDFALRVAWAPKV